MSIKPLNLNEIPAAAVPRAEAEKVSSTEGVDQDARSFERLLEQAKDSGSARLHRQDADEDMPARYGDLLAPDATSNQVSLASVSSAASASVMSSIDTIRRIDQLVEFLAVSAPADATQTVVLKLSPDILPDTTVSIQVTGGMLEVVFTQGPGGDRLPADINFQALAERLAASSNGIDVKIIAPAASGFEPAAYLGFASKNAAKRGEKEREEDGK